MDILFTPQSCRYSLKNPLFVTLGRKCPYFKMVKTDAILDIGYWILMSHTFL